MADVFDRAPPTQLPIPIEPTEPLVTKQQTKYEDNIKEALANGRLTVVVGAGVSIRALQASRHTGEDIEHAVESMSWLGLLRHGLKYSEEEEDVLSSMTWADRIELEAYKRIVDNTTVPTANILRAASFLKSVLARKIDNWFDLEFEGIYDTFINHDPSPILDALQELYNAGARVITTNYDDLLDKHIGANAVLSDDTSALKLCFRNKRTWICIGRNVGISIGHSSEGSVEKALDWQTENHGWLLIVDNVDDEASLDMLHCKFLRAGFRGFVLLTSRSSVVTNQWDAIEVNGMTEQEGRSLIQKITGQEPAKEPAALAFLTTLGYLPLAIDQAACYIKSADISVAEYYERYKTARLEYLQEHPSTR